MGVGGSTTVLVYKREALLKSKKKNDSRTRTKNRVNIHNKVTKLNI